MCCCAKSARLSAGRSGWSVIFTVLGAGQFLQPVEPLVDLAEVLPDGPELLHERQVLGRVASVFIRPGNAGDEMPAFLRGYHETFAAQDVKPVADGHGRDAVLPGQLALGRQLVADLVPARRDGRAQVVGDLLVRGALVPVGDHWHGPTLPSPQLAGTALGRVGRHVRLVLYSAL
jgi:hypothetical protein